MTLTYHLSDTIDALIAKLQENAVQLGLEDVWYGEQDLIPRTPAVCVEPVDIDRTWSGTSTQTENKFQVHIILYVSTLKGAQTMRRETDKLAEQIADLINSDVNLGGLVLIGFVDKIEAGYNIKQGKLMWSSRLTWSALNKTFLT